MSPEMQALQHHASSRGLAVGDIVSALDVESGRRRMFQLMQSSMLEKSLYLRRHGVLRWQTKHEIVGDAGLPFAVGYLPRMRGCPGGAAPHCMMPPSPSSGNADERFPPSYTRNTPI